MAEKMEGTGKGAQVSDSQFKKPPTSVIIGLQNEDRGCRRIVTGI